MTYNISRFSFFINFFFVSCFLALFSCNSNPYGLRIATSGNKNGKSVVFGLIDRRDISSQRSLAMNFKDMLEFEFFREGFTILQYIPSVESPTEETKGENESYRTRIGLLPESLRKSAGEFNARVDYTLVSLSESEINDLSSRLNFDYFIQGSISVYSNNSILEETEFNILNLVVYGPQGNRLGMISSSFENRALYEANLMRKLCEEILLKFVSHEKEFVNIKKSTLLEEIPE